MTPKTVVITGASDGIGAAAARELHQRGHRVVVVGRQPEKARRVAESAGGEHLTADFGRLSEVRKLAASLLATYPRIDVLANNAGGIFGDRARTADGFERTFQINHLAPFLLTRLLLDRLIASSATVIQTSSVGARVSAPTLDVDDLELDHGFGPIRAYGATKLANILFTKELQRRFGSQGLAAVAFHPGNIASNFGKQTESRLVRFMVTFPLTRAVLFAPPETGAGQLVWLAEGRPGVDWTPGEYYEKRRVARTNPQASDTELAHRLWERSEQLLAS